MEEENFIHSTIRHLPFELTKRWFTKSSTTKKKSHPRINFFLMLFYKKIHTRNTFTVHRFTHTQKGNKKCVCICVCVRACDVKKITVIHTTTHSLSRRFSEHIYDRSCAKCMCVCVCMCAIAVDRADHQMASFVFFHFAVHLCPLSQHVL